MGLVWKGNWLESNVPENEGLVVSDSIQSKRRESVHPGRWVDTGRRRQRLPKDPVIDYGWKPVYRWVWPQ
jgi:hypothetical protein